MEQPGSSQPYSQQQQQEDPALYLQRAVAETERYEAEQRRRSTIASQHEKGESHHYQQQSAAPPGMSRVLVGGSMYLHVDREGVLQLPEPMMLGGHGGGGQSPRGAIGGLRQTANLSARNSTGRRHGWK
jgi:hypothetical protein